MTLILPKTSAFPRWATSRTVSRPTIGPQLAAQARALGFEFMPWQQQVADVAGELVREGDVFPDSPTPDLWVPAYREVVIYVPRQSGKTTYILAKVFQRARGWYAERGPQHIAYTAQTGSDASKKFRDDWVPIVAPRRRDLGVRQVRLANGNEGLVWENGSRLSLLASSPDAGHGKTIDEGFKDEFFADTDDRRDQALGPAMITRRAAQVTTVSTAGTEESVPLNQLVERGRAAVEAGRTDGIAFFEWSADPDDDPDDPATWRACMPAWGFTQFEPVVRTEREKMRDGEFRRAYLNQPTLSDDRVIPAAMWASVCQAGAKPLDLEGRPAFAVDMNPERSHTSIAVASGGSIPTAELIDYTSDSVVARCAEMQGRHRLARFAVSKSGPAGALIAPLEAAGVNVAAYSSADEVAACGDFYDRVSQGRVVVRPHARLDVAVAAAMQRPVGDAWAWGRKHSNADVSPLVALTLAVRESQQAKPARVFAY